MIIILLIIILTKNYLFYKIKKTIYYKFFLNSYLCAELYIMVLVSPKSNVT